MDRKKFQATLRRAFWVPFGIALVLAATLILEVRFLMERAAWVEHTGQVIAVAQRIYRNRVDQETGLRAYVLTGDTRFLEPFYEGRRQASALEPQLRQLVADNPEQTARNEDSFRAFAAWSSWADEAIALTKGGEDAGNMKFQLRGKGLMDEYRRTRTAFIEREQQLREERVARSRRALELLNATIVALSILFALGFAVLGRKQLLSLSRSFNEALNNSEANAAEARSQRDWLHTTLTGIGDAVIATDAGGLITLMNPVAEKLTGWTLKEAQGKPLSEVFRIVNQETHQSVENPVDKVRRLNRAVGLANHTILVNKSGQEVAIDDSGAPIFGPNGALTGIVLVFRDVTEQRRTQKAIAQLAAIVEFSGDAIITKNLDGILQTWNAGAERLFGYKAGEIIGKPVTVLIPPDRLNEETEILQRIRQGRPSERLETVRLAKDGTPIRVSVGVSPIKDVEGRVIGASKVIHDITELAASRAELLREKELVATTLTSIGDAVIATDAEGRITFLNAEAERLTAWKTSDATGRPLPEVFRIINEETRQIVDNPVDKALRLGTVVGLANHTVLLTKDGREIPIDDSAAPIRVPGGQLFGVVLVFRDFTARKQAMTQLAQSQKTLFDLVERAPFGIYIVDSQFCISVMNSASQTGAFRNVKPVIGRDFGEAMRILWPTDVAREIIAVFRHTLETGEPYYSPRFTNPRHDIGAVESYEWELHRIRLADGQYGVICYYFDSTKLRQAEQGARDAQERLSGLINSAMDAVISVDPRQQIVMFNPAAEKMFGCAASEALGNSLDRFIPARFREVHRQHIEHFGQTGVTNRTMFRPGTLWGQRHNGEEFPIEATISQVETGGQKLFTVILRDITERKEAESKLAEQANLLELTSDAIIVRDEAGRIAYWNKGAEDLYGWAREEAIGKSTRDLLQTTFPQPLEEIIDRVRKEKHWQGELLHTRKGGELVTVLSRWALVEHEKVAGVPSSLMEINTDISRRKQLEAALQSNERLALAGRLSASIAHEIHNPLDTVGNVLFLLSQRVGKEPGARQLIGVAQKEVQRVTEISKNMLSLHRESRSASPVKISELLEGVVALIEETIAKGSREIHLLLGFEGEVEAFPSELRQVFTNVIKNAVEATAEGGEIKIFSEAARESGRNGVLVRVVDDGVGISEEMQSRLFSPFVSSKEESGTGLGLWVSHSIVEKHGGTIRISSSSDPEDCGTTVSIFLPLEATPRKKVVGATPAA